MIELKIAAAVFAVFVVGFIISVPLAHLIEEALIRDFEKWIGFKVRPHTGKVHSVKPGGDHEL